MKVIQGNIWQFSAISVIGIPTNGYIKRDFSGVMGRGIALQAKDRYPQIEVNLGRHIIENGHVVGWILQYPLQIISLPVKPEKLLLKDNNDISKVQYYLQDKVKLGQSVPGFQCKADPKIVNIRWAKDPAACPGQKSGKTIDLLH